MNIYDVIIVGSGIAGLNASALFDKSKKVLVLCKDNSWNCNTFYAQGGVAVALDEEDINLHIQDTISAGDGLCDKEAVEILCKDGFKEIQNWIKRGFEFDRDKDGKLLYTKEAAHSKNRILHAGGDATGRYMHLFLMRENQNTLLYKSTVTDLLIEDDICYGVRVSHLGEIKNFYAKSVIIATGGIGSLYEYHTNSKSISADLHGICITKGIKLRDMEMLQFHPTAYIHNRGARKQLLSEALRGEGAYIVDENGKRFLFDYDKRAELSPRNIVAQAIYDYRQKTNLEIYLNFDNFTKEFFKKRFPTIYFNLKDLGFNLPDDNVPISPAFHYAMGGIETDLNAKVKGFKNLYAIGEVASTRVHGANRLASNSLLEGIVFSKRAVDDIESKTFDFKIKEFSKNEDILIKDGDKELKHQLRVLMWKNAGIIRSYEGLKSTLEWIDDKLDQKRGKLLKLRLLTSKEIIKSALKRKKSLGAHYMI